jgi:nucleoside-diphosphate-sugar epimerase
LDDRYRIFALARGGPEATGAPRRHNIEWLRADIGNSEQMRAAERRIAATGGLDLALHLAAYYDFTGDPAPEYRRTNVEGTRIVLDTLSRLRPRHLIFASSVAACDFTSGERVINEHSPPDGQTLYAESKRLGERLIRANDRPFTASIVRLAALYSDWCEYEPLYNFLAVWLSSSWRRRILAGAGRAAIPFLHIDDAVAFFRRLLVQYEVLNDGEVLLASPDGSTTHAELHAGATACHFGQRLRPILVPRPACRVGIRVLDAAGRLSGHRPFERIWMGRCIDRRLDVDASHTRQRLGWQPRNRLAVIRRTPFLIQNRKAHHAEWLKRNHIVAYRTRLRASAKVHELLSRHQLGICRRFREYLSGPAQQHRFADYLSCSEVQLEDRHRLLIDQLMSAVLNGDKGIFMTCCQHMAERWYADGKPLGQLLEALEALGETALAVLREDREAKGLSQNLYDHITMTIQFAMDAVHEVDETFGQREQAAAERDH